MRVLQIIPALAFGGLERIGTTLAVGLKGRVASIAVCSSGVRGFIGGRTLAAELDAAGVAVIPIPRPSPADPWRYARSVAALAAVLRRERPDVVHAHNPAAAAAVAAARALARCGDTAIVTTHHGVSAERVPRATAVLRRSSDLVVGIGPTVSRELQAAGLPPSRSVTILNAVDIRATRPRADVRREFGSEDSELIVTVGRYEAEKNQRLLIAALAVLRRERPQVRALVVGYGRLEDELRRQVRDLSLEDVVAITGPRDDAVDITAAADVFALTSQHEGLGLVVLEAMAVGCPVVATAVGGVPDIVHDGETGLLAPPGSAEGVAAALARVLGDAELRSTIAEGGRRMIVRDFNVGLMVDRYVEVYERALELRRTR